MFIVDPSVSKGKPFHHDFHSFPRLASPTTTAATQTATAKTIATETTTIETSATTTG